MHSTVHSNVTTIYLFLIVCYTIDANQQNFALLRMMAATALQTVIPDSSKTTFSAMHTLYTLRGMEECVCG